MNLMDNLQLGVESKYKIHELIFINSGSNHYVRLPVNVHAALLSNNNSGKTSTLSALKLFLLPEISFKRSKDKFGFSSGGKYYSDIDSYQYYFPGLESYIICNATNPRGNLCWLLHRTTDLGYERIVVPKEFDEIEHLFWNHDSPHNEGAGQLQPDIAVTDIKKYLLSRDYGGEVLNDRSTIGEAIYTRTSTLDDHTRYSLLPMVKKFSASSVETVRALLGMAFSLGDASTSTLPSAIGSIIDGMGMSVVKNDGIFLDLDNALEEWRTLKAQDSHLSTVILLREKWTELVETKEQYNLLFKTVRSDYLALSWSLQVVQNQYQASLDEVREQAKQAEIALNNYSIEFREVETLFNQCKAELKATNQQISKLEDQISAVELARSHLQPLCPPDDKSDEAILIVLNEQISHCEDEIKYLKGEEDIQIRMASLTKSIKENEANIKQLQANLIQMDKGESFLDSLDKHTASVLLSLNTAFAEINPELTLKQKTTVESFGSLFSEYENYVVFADTPLRRVRYRSLNTEESKIDLNHQINALKGEVNYNRRKQEQLAKTSKRSPAERLTRLKECELELKQLQAQQRDLKGFETLKNILLENQEKASSLSQQFEERQAELDVSRAKFNELKLSYSNLKFKVDEVKGPADDIQSFINDLGTIAHRSNGLLDIELPPDYETDAKPQYEPERFKDGLNQLSQNVSAAQATKRDRNDKLLHLLNYEIVESSPEDRHAIAVSLESFNSYFAALETIFSNVEKARESYKERLHAHNNTAATSTRIIENVQGIIESFIDGINQELGHYEISNLDRVDLVAELHPQYLNMVGTLSRVSSRSDSLLPENFYQQIGEFQSNFYIRKTGKINISRLIEKINYRFNRNGKKETLPQSNGTNCMINAVLLALLLKRMIPEDLELSVPVIFDEVGSLDEHNLKEILKVMEEHGLVLFAANPEPTGVIASVLNVYHDLAIFGATDVEVQGKAESIYFPGMEERLEDILGSKEADSD